MTLKYNKLVRDNIPSIITGQGKTPITRVLSDDEYISCLGEKLLEEVTEYLEDSSIEEFCDILEVLDAIKKAKGFLSADIDTIRATKAKKNGKFDKKIFLEEVIAAMPYKHCPIYETTNFTLRLVSEKDATDLLVCYSDPKAQELFNIDGFPHNCNFTTQEEMLSYIKFWLMEYSQEAYVRFAVVDKATNKAIGTVEMFGSKDGTGILRIDLASKYEKQVFLDELLSVSIKNFYDLFNVNCIATKAISKAVKRTHALINAGFTPAEFNGRAHYYLRSRSDLI